MLAAQVELNAKLNGSRLLYQQYLKAMEIWESKLSELMGTPDAPEILKGLQSRIAQLESLPGSLEEQCTQRLELTDEIFDILDAQRKAREQLFKPVQDLIQENSLIREEYKLQFQAALGGSPDLVSDDLFTLIKQNSGAFRGEDESYIAVRKIAEQYDFNNKDDILKFVTELHGKIVDVPVAAGRTNLVFHRSLGRINLQVTSMIFCSGYHFLSHATRCCSRILGLNNSTGSKSSTATNFLPLGRQHRCLYQIQKVDSDTERRFPVIPEKESDTSIQKWYKPAKGQFQIFYKSGRDHLGYQLDFVVEMTDRIFMVETKIRKDMEVKEVLAKKEAAIKWCGHATDHAQSNGGKP